MTPKSSKKSPSKNQDPESTEPSAIPDFEQSLGELESLIEHMEQGDLTLEQSLEHFERGVRLTKTCQQALDEAQLKVEQLLSGGELGAFDGPTDD